MDAIEVVGETLSLAALGLLVWVGVDMFRLGAGRPAPRLGPMSLPPGLVRWAWLLVLWGAYLGGNTITLLARTEVNGHAAFGWTPIDRIPAGTMHSRGIQHTGWGRTTLPFYHAEQSHVEFADGRPGRRIENRALVFPWVFTLVVLACWFGERNAAEEAGAAEWGDGGRG
ncbi:MAG TPA: hypothetical protein VFQ38_09505 [Longimicrobiales bacterium]|nr:hypothetical protein [Longimicrobiales bacterium]